LSDPREVLERIFPAMFAKDRATLGALLAEDVVWHLPPFAKAKPRRGREKAIDFLCAAPDAFYQPGSLSLEPELVAVEGDRAMLLGWMTGTTRAGGPYENRYAFAMRFRAGQIVEAWELLDSKRLFEQIG
jgi:ketosteroid isomerase-like protein